MIIATAGVAAYLIIAAWTFGYCAGKWAEEEEKYKGWYYDEPPTYIAAAFFPIYLLFAFVLRPVVNLGERRGVKSVQARKLRVVLEKKIRVEQEKFEKEAAEEIEAELRKENVA